MFVLFFSFFCFSVDLIYMPDNQQQRFGEIEETQIMALDAIIDTRRRPVSVQATFLVKKFTKSIIVASLKHPFYPHFYSVSSIITTFSGSVISYFP